MTSDRFADRPGVPLGMTLAAMAILAAVSIGTAALWPPPPEPAFSAPVPLEAATVRAPSCSQTPVVPR